MTLPLPSADTPVDRETDGRTLWPDGPDERAADNLRLAVWRLRTSGIDILQAEEYTLCL
jgi:DNA-binding SARP family transcriptional activator